MTGIRGEDGSSEANVVLLKRSRWGLSPFLGLLVLVFGMIAASLLVCAWLAVVVAVAVAGIVISGEVLTRHLLLRVSLCREGRDTGLAIEVRWFSSTVYSKRWPDIEHLEIETEVSSIPEYIVLRHWLVAHLPDGSAVEVLGRYLDIWFGFEQHEIEAVKEAWAKYAEKRGVVDNVASEKSVRP